MDRTCPNCRKRLDSLALRCACGYVWPEARDIRSDPERPRCGVCRGEMELMTERCPACGAEGYPALRPRRGKKSLGSPD
ncbi:MAG: hypothetical protein ACREKI_08465 [Gemmatimonadota bacterium]